MELCDSIKTAGYKFVGVMMAQRLTDTIIKNELGIDISALNPQIKKQLDRLIKRHYIETFNSREGEITGYECVFLKLGWIYTYSGLRRDDLAAVSKAIKFLHERKLNIIRKSIQDNVWKQTGL